MPPRMGRHKETSARKHQSRLDIMCAKVAYIYSKLHLKSFLLIFLVLCYAFIGAAIFHALEGQEEIDSKEHKTKSAIEDAKNISSTLVYIFQECGGPGDLDYAQKIVEEMFHAYQEKHGLTVDESASPKWDFWGSMFYAATLFTTIGYGHYAPATDGGRVATMLYSLLGIPLVLATLQDLGKLLTRMIRHPWNLIRIGFNRCCRKLFRKRFKTREPGDSETGDSLLSSTASTQEQEEEFDFPIGFVIVLFFLYICCLAPLFCAWEDWSYFTSFYYVFISLTTIGLGDVVPRHTRLMLLSFPLLMVGLSLISMCINLIQQRMEELKEQGLDMFEDQFGFETDSGSEADEDAEADAEGRVKEKEKKRSPKSSASRTYRPTLGIFGGRRPNLCSDLFGGAKKRRRSDKVAPQAVQAAARVMRAARGGEGGKGAVLPGRRVRRGVQTNESSFA